ncbi:unnamed protein product [Schistocephalus solidus]|uniref:Insulin-degrading enzyme n=1 Tax=Schistocephalus solidus TaxID=70667 RepID=A0A3P7CK66_SCHSO|nr:unnamed protein product [Schistocephalus solidus]
MQGLAHFCEHMILLGSDKYPEENAYSKFINEHGGFCNAYTSAEETSFVFDLAPEHLGEALDIFSTLFVSPRFTEGSIEREVNAVEAEHEKNLSSDLRRLIQLDKTMSSTEHDYCKFSTGNRVTLLEEPKSKNIIVRNELLKFHSTYYSANLMGVTLLGKESLDEMEAKFTPMFASIKDNNVEPRVWSTSPWTSDFLQKKIYMTPVKDIHELHVFWPIADYTEHYKSRPSGYLGHLLGHEASGSLLSTLKNLSLANELSAGTYRPATGFACFLLRLTLTERGVGIFLKFIRQPSTIVNFEIDFLLFSNSDNVDEIITMIFQYIAMVRQSGIQEWIFNEDRDLEALRFRFKGKENPYQYVATLSSRLFLYPPEDVLSASYLLTEFRPDLIEEILSCLVPDRLRCFIVSPKVSSRCTLKEHYYGTNFGYESIPDQLIEFKSEFYSTCYSQNWKNCGLREDFHLPRPNPYVPFDFTLKTEIKAGETDEGVSPKLLRQEQGSRLWFKEDKEHKLPKVFVNFNLISPFWCQDPVVDLLYQLFVSVLADSINEEVYLGSLAGMYFSITPSAPAIRITFSGFNHKMPLFVDKLLYQLMSFRKPDENRFACLLADLEQRVNNFATLTTYEQADGHLASVIYDRVWTFAERQAALKELTYDELVNFIPSFLSRVFIETLVYGNALPVEAQRYHDIILKYASELGGRHPPVAAIPCLSREIILPYGKSHVYIQPNLHQPSSAILIYLQCATNNTADNALHRLFVQVFSESAFNKLRTEKQLGYVVSLGWHRSSSMQGVRILIQSKLHPKDLDFHIETFLASIDELLENLTPEEFRCHVESVISALLEKPKKMNQQNTRYWSQIVHQTYDFEQNKKEAEHLSTVNQRHLVEFYRTHIHAESARRRKLAIHVVSASADKPSCENSDNVIIISNPTQFKRTSPLAALVKSAWNFEEKVCDA